MLEAVKQILKSYITEELLYNFGTVEFDDNLLADDMIDSIGMMRLVGFVEEKFELKIPHEDLVIENFQSISVIAEYLAGRNLSLPEHVD